MWLDFFLHFNKTTYHNRLNIEAGIRIQLSYISCEYIKNSLEYEQSSKLTYDNQLEEEIFLGFRKMSGINLQIINQKYDIDFEQKYSDVMKKYSQFFVKTGEGYALNIQGVMVSNIILSEFLQ